MGELSPHQQVRFDRLYNEVPDHVREAVIVWWYESGLTGAQAMERLATLFGALVRETQGAFCDFTAAEAIAGGVLRRESAEVLQFRPKEEE